MVSASTVSGWGSGYRQSKLDSNSRLSSGQARTILRFHGSPFHKNTICNPEIENIQATARIHPNRYSEEVCHTDDFSQSLPKKGKNAAVMSGLLSIPRPNDARPVANPRHCKQEVLDDPD
jgi:hypothetical protein